MWLICSNGCGTTTIMMVVQLGWQWCREGGSAHRRHCTQAPPEAHHSPYGTRWSCQSSRHQTWWCRQTPCWYPHQPKGKPHRRPWNHRYICKVLTSCSLPLRCTFAGAAALSRTIQGHHREILFLQARAGTLSHVWLAPTIFTFITCYFVFFFYCTHFCPEYTHDN